MKCEKIKTNTCNLVASMIRIQQWLSNENAKLSYIENVSNLHYADTNTHN